METERRHGVQQKAEQWDQTENEAHRRQEALSCFVSKEKTHAERRLLTLYCPIPIQTKTIDRSRICSLCVCQRITTGGGILHSVQSDSLDSNRSTSFH